MNRCLAVYAQKSPQALELAIHSAEIASARWDKYPANSLDKKMGYDHKDASAKLELEL